MFIKNKFLDPSQVSLYNITGEFRNFNAIKKLSTTVLDQNPILLTKVNIHLVTLPLKTDIIYINMLMLYLCDQCEYLACTISRLKREAGYEALRYPCPVINVNGTFSHLKKHKKSSISYNPSQVSSYHTSGSCSLLSCLFILYGSLTEVSQYFISRYIHENGCNHNRYIIKS